MDIVIPFQIPAKCVENHYKTESEVYGFVLFKKHVGINGKNAMPMGNSDQFKRHRGSALHGIKVTAGKTEAAVAAEGDKFRYYSALRLHSNITVLSALVMYTFCTKNVQNGTIKLIFLTKNMSKILAFYGRLNCYQISTFHSEDNHTWHRQKQDYRSLSSSPRFQ